MVQLGCIQYFGLGRGEHIQNGVASPGVVKVLDVIGDSDAEFLARGPCVGVQQFNLHPAPERLDGCIGVAISNVSHTQS